MSENQTTGSDRTDSVTENNGDFLSEVLIEFLNKYWDQFTHTILMIQHSENLNEKERKIEFLKGFKLNVDKIVTNEKWAKYIVGRVFHNKCKNFYEECIYWFLHQVYLVDRTTTKNSLYSLALNDISDLRNSVLLQGLPTKTEE